MKIASGSPPLDRPQSPGHTAAPAPVSAVVGEALRVLYNGPPPAPVPVPVEDINQHNAAPLPDGHMPLEILRHTHPQLVSEVTRELRLRMPGAASSQLSKDIECLSNRILMRAERLARPWPPGHVVHVRLFEIPLEQGPHRFTIDQVAAWEASAPPGPEPAAPASSRRTDDASRLLQAQIVFPWPPLIYRS